MVFKGVYTSDDTHFHNKEARLRGATSPRHNREAQRARSLPSPGAAQGPAPGRELSAVGAAEGKVGRGRAGKRAGPAGAGRSVDPRTGVAPKGRTATPPPAAI